MKTVTHPARNPLIIKSFTLIELLVVVAIIAILAAMLLPALNKAREMGKKAACANNVKQVFSAAFNYMDDNNGWMCKGYATEGTVIWFNHLINKKYLINKSRTQWICPTMSSMCVVGTTYLMGINMHTFNVFCKNNMIKKPSLLYFISGDSERKSAVWSFGNNYELYKHSYLPASLYGRFFACHNGYGNIIFFDGHVASLNKLDDTSPDNWVK